MYHPVVRVSPKIVFLLEIFPNRVLCICVHSAEYVQQQKKEKEEITKITEGKSPVAKDSPGRKDKNQHVFYKPVSNINTVEIHIEPHRYKRND